MEANNKNPDQAVSNLGPYCLQYGLPMDISRREEQTTKVVTGGLRVEKYVSPFHPMSKERAGQLVNYPRPRKNSLAI